MKKGTKTLLLYLFMIAAVIIAVTAVSGSFKPKELTYSEVRDLFKDVKVESFEVSNTGILTMTLYEVDENGNVNYEKTQEKKISYALFSISFFASDIYEQSVTKYDEGFNIVKSDSVYLNAAIEMLEAEYEYAKGQIDDGKWQVNG